MSEPHEHLGADAREAQLSAAGLAPVREVEPLVFNPNNAVTGVVERLSLSDGTDVVRKVLLADAEASVPHWAAGTDPDHWNYWRREADAYLYDPAAGGFESILPREGIRAPELLGHVEPAGGVEVLFLELVDGRSGPELGAADLATLATGLGRWQGPFVVDSPEPADTEAAAFPTVDRSRRDRSRPDWSRPDRSRPDWSRPDRSRPDRSSPDWLSRDWMWNYALSRPPGPRGYRDDVAWSHPMVLEGFGGSVERIRSGFGLLHDELHEWRSISEQLPMVPSHLDCWANNAIVVDDQPPVLFDWSFCGFAHLGADAGNLVPDGLLDHYGEPNSYGELDRLVTHAYLAGLADAGWRGAAEVVRLGMCLAAVKFAWLPALMVANAEWSGPTGYGGQQGLDHAEVFSRRAVVFEAMLDQIDEARALVQSLGFAS